MKVLFALLLLLLGIQHVGAAEMGEPQKKHVTNNKQQDKVSLAKAAAERGEAGVYRLEVRVSGDVAQYAPEIWYCGKLSRQSSSPSFVDAVDSLAAEEDSLSKSLGLGDEWNRIKMNMVTISYEDAPLCFEHPIVIETLPIPMVAP